MKEIRSPQVLSFLLLLFSCTQQQNPEMYKVQGETQGTYYAITWFDRPGSDLEAGFDSVLLAVDRSVSLWNPSSALCRINEGDTAIMADAIFSRVFELSKEVHFRSGGAFDPTVGPLVNAWGFGFKGKLEMTPERVDSLRGLLGFDEVQLRNGHVLKARPGIRLDFNAIAQGYAVDLLGEYLDSEGIENYLVDIGGEVLAKGTKPGGEHWKVGIEKPAGTMDDSRVLQTIVRITDQAIATSGNYRKYFEKDGIRYSHTIDPSSGYPVRHSLLSVTIMADRCVTADAWATAFMVMGLEKAVQFLEQEKEMEAFFIYSDTNGQVKTHATPGFARILESTEPE
ncbi:MAG: FAD:protein FMN transferase [Bacteroidales bacterium]|nr:FAD:protein FMN transferase [Bacteroidales bacterium]